MEDTHLHYLQSRIQTRNHRILAKSKDPGEPANYTTGTIAASTPS